MSRVEAMFARERPLIGVIHLPRSLGLAGFSGIDPSLDALAADLRALSEGGVDGVLLENDDDEPTDLVVSKAQVAWITRASIFARERVRAPLGLGVQRIDWEASIAIAAAAELDFVRLDVFVDRVRMGGREAEVAPRDVVALRRALDAERVLLFTDVHVKHAELLSEGDIATSARQAAEAGSDCVLVTGARTGEPPDVADLRAARRAAAPIPVCIGSGLTPERAREMAAECDSAVVGTALKAGGRIDAAKVARMVRAWRDACA